MGAVATTQPCGRPPRLHAVGEHLRLHRVRRFEQRRALVRECKPATRTPAAARPECVRVLGAEGAGEPCARVAEQWLGFVVAAQLGKCLAECRGSVKCGRVVRAQRR